MIDKQTLPHGMAVVLACSDLFQTLYLQASIEQAGATIIGPITDAMRLLELVGEPSCCSAVILAGDLVGTMSGDLPRELHEHGIAHLILIDPAQPVNDLTSGRSPTLHWPYAAYQVVNWLAGLPRPEPVGKSEA